MGVDEGTVAKVIWGWNLGYESNIFAVGGRTCMTQASLSDCAAVGTSHRDNPTGVVSLVGEGTDKPPCTHPW